MRGILSKLCEAEDPYHQSLWTRLEALAFRVYQQATLYKLRGRLMESLKYALTTPKVDKRFHIVSAERNAGKAAIRCLDSVHTQRYDNRLVRHVFVDDASTDDTDRIITDWLAEHANHNVEYIRNSKRSGGCANNVLGFRMAEPSSIVMHLDGDDWLPDDGVLEFLNRVYDDPAIWMTYNSFVLFDGVRHRQVWWTRHIPHRVLQKNAIRQHPWVSSHLHTFRAQLFSHVEQSSLVDPETGDYWASAVDQAVYLPMLELAGEHSCHIHRVLYVYNAHEACLEKTDFQATLDRRRRIRLLPPYCPLDTLSVTRQPATSSPPR